MQLTDILKPQCIKVPLLATNKDDAIEELVQLLVVEGRVADAEAIKRAVWQREATRTTGIGHGLAIPHGKSATCDRLVMAIGKPDTPIDFNSIDGKPVQVIFLIVGPPDQTGPHIQALARISRLMMRPEIRSEIYRSHDATGIYQIIEREEKVAV